MSKERINLNKAIILKGQLSKLEKKITETHETLKDVQEKMLTIRDKAVEINNTFNYKEKETFKETFIDSLIQALEKNELVLESRISEISKSIQNAQPYQDLGVTFVMQQIEEKKAQKTQLARIKTELHSLKIEFDKNSKLQVELQKQMSTLEMRKIILESNLIQLQPKQQQEEKDAAAQEKAEPLKEQRQEDVQEQNSIPPVTIHSEAITPPRGKKATSRTNKAFPGEKATSRTNKKISWTTSFLQVQEKEDAATQEKAASLKEQRQEDVTDYIKALEQYKTDRAASYSVKDRISSTDKKEREKFIDKLSGALQEFVESNDPTYILTLIQDNIDRFPGVHLQTILHRITLQFVKPTPTEDVHQAALRIISQLVDRQPKYAKKIKNLYEKIEDIAAFSKQIDTPMEKEIVKKLAHELRNDVDHFIKDTQGSLPSPDTYKKFQTTFTARAHSQDLPMIKHDRLMQIILSVVAAATGIGLFVLAAVAVHSKIKSGHFFPTTSQRVLANVKQSLRDIDNPTKDSESKPDDPTT